MRTRASSNAGWTKLADFPTETHRFPSFDGVEIAWTEMGEGRPVVLIHGYFSTAEVNWIKYGHAAKLAASGFRVIMPRSEEHTSELQSH